MPRARSFPRGRKGPSRNGNAPSDWPLNCDLWASSQSRAFDLISRNFNAQTPAHSDARPKRAPIPQIVLALHVNVGPSQPLNFDNADAAYDLLAEHVERFIEAWDAPDGQPALVDYLPHSPAAVRRLGLIELIKVDLEYRQQRGC